jgi:hypothetical protein
MHMFKVKIILELYCVFYGLPAGTNVAAMTHRTVMLQYFHSLPKRHHNVVWSKRPSYCVVQLVCWNSSPLWRIMRLSEVRHRTEIMHRCIKNRNHKQYSKTFSLHGSFKHNRHEVQLFWAQRPRQFPTALNVCVKKQYEYFGIARVALIFYTLYN